MQIGKRAIVHPVEGATAMDPYSRVVPKEGASVIWSSHWQRRLNEGVITVSEIEEPKPPATKSRKKPTSKPDSEE